jgi:hypothetical protein
LTTVNRPGVSGGSISWKAVQDDAQLAGERNRLMLEVRRARVARRKHVVSAAPARRMARLLLRRAPA